jgi:uncharacterized protein YqgQ
VSKFTAAEKDKIKSIVANLHIKQVPDSLIIQEVRRQTSKTISKRTLYYVRERIKKESYIWYLKLRKDNYEFIHEFRERIREINDLQQKHYLIVNSTSEPTSVRQTSMVELHKLNITLSNYYDIAPYIVSNIGQLNRNRNDNNPIPIKSENQEQDIIV